ncbi:hypothetical protein EON82_00435 [bacterium]|nr:MAG: hypothetical protein EON82_00435 [bacterium]
MASLLKKLVLAAATAVLVGCGGSSIKNPAHVRFFNGFSDRQDVRAKFGTELYDAPGVDPNVPFANQLSYGRSPSGSVTITAGPYADLNTTWASLANQGLVSGLNYTVVGTTVSNTRTLYLFEDGVAPVSNTTFVRIINAAGTQTVVHFTIRQASDSTIVYQTGTGGQAVGTSTGYRSFAVNTTDPVAYQLNVYSTNTLNNPISDTIPITLQQGRPTTVVLYNGDDGRVRARTGIDVREL